jgi:CubicO group peptidase (beta-lactamase class C family)
VELDRYLAEQHRQGRWSGAVFVSYAGQDLLDTAYGIADRETGRPNTPRTGFQIASISKQFTAAAILLLQEQKRLSVQASLAAWVPECPAEWEPITVHHLLTHTSGIGHWRDFPELNLYTPTTRENLLHLFSARPLLFPPGAGWAYSSPGYVLLAHIVEQSSGESYATFMQRSLFQPLGLTSTTTGTHAPGPEQLAVGHEHGKPLPSFDLDTVSIGAGDIWSTTHDLARWDAALVMPGLILSEPSLQAMFAAHTPVPDDFARVPGAGYGYGWCLAEMGGQQARFHPGDNSGFNAVNIQLPYQQALVILLSNDEDSDIPAISLRLVGELLDRESNNPSSGQ